MRARQLSAVCVGLWAMGAVAPLLFAGQDELVIKNTRGEETSIQGEIKEETLERIKMVDGSGRPMPDFGGNQVVNIKWGIEDYEYQRGMSEYGRGNYLAAATALKAYLEGGSVRRSAVAHVRFMCGDSYRRANKPAEAEEVLDPLVQMQSWYVPDAIDRLVDVCIVASNFQKVNTLLDRLRKMGPKYEARAIMYEGDLLRMKGQVDDAVGKYNVAIEKTTDPESQGEARMKLAECQVLKKDFKGASATALKVLAGQAPPRVLAAAHVVIGNALLQQAQPLDPKTDPAKELYLDAILEFLYVPLLYAGNERYEGEALFKAGECFKALSKNADRRGDRRRAFEMYTQVRQKFPGSFWAKQAEKAIADVQ